MTHGFQRRGRMPRCIVAAATAWLPAASQSQAVTQPLDRVEIVGDRPSSLPIVIPTTLEGITGAQVAQRINATDAEDALKYLPSLSVRKRYIGDYDHAVLATRASGTGNSARSLVYADGILLSNLLGNGASFTPRWGLVTPEEIERVDVLYGPFSAAYPGNSAGAIVDYVTRMPTKLEAHVKLQGFTQHDALYGTNKNYSGGQASASIGSRNGAWSWWIDLNRLDSEGQPISFVVKNLAASTSAAGTPVTGAFLDLNPKNVPGWVLGSTTRTHTVQDHAKLKLAYDITPTLRATYLVADWRNEASRSVDSYLRDSNGRVVTSGPVAQPINIAGRSYSVLPTDFAASTADIEHVMQSIGIKSDTRGRWDWEASASVYDERRDSTRSQMPNAAQPAAGRLADQAGTGWNTLAAKGIFRPDGPGGAHVAEFGLQREAFKLRTNVADTPEWTAAAPAARFSNFAGDTTLTSAWAQDAWRFAPKWRAVLGGRFEHWRASDGSLSDATTTRPFAAREENHVSPKAAVSFAPDDDWRLKASLGRAVRMPTVSELYQGSLSAGEIVNNDPNLKPEKSWTGELSAEREMARSSLRATLFFERTTDALYSQVNAVAGGTLATVQNVGAVHTRGFEGAWRADDVGVKGLSMNASLTYAHSIVTSNANLPASVGKWQPRVPQWRSSFVASYAPDDRWTTTLGLRYAGRQFGQLDNSDVNGNAYTGFSPYFVADARVHYRFDRRWSGAVGIDNLNNAHYWAFHPYPQRTFSAEIRFDL